MRALVTGGAGFIGSRLSESLSARGYDVRIFDNFSTGKRRFIEESARSSEVQIVEGDLLDASAVRTAMDDVDVVFHLAANADVRHGFEDTQRDLKQNVMATYNVLEAMRLQGVKKMVFASTSAAIGEPTAHPTPEDLPMPIQTSLYGASKVAAEGMITAFANGFGMSALIFRFVSVLGPRYSHGHVFDFVGQLLNNPRQLRILGDGKQQKSYMHVEDCVSAVIRAHESGAAEQGEFRSAVFNLGVNDYCLVAQSAKWIAEEMGLEPEFVFTGGRRGWVGDNPFVFLDTRKIRDLGWTTKWTIEASVRDTVKWLIANQWIFAERN